jgi:hypothetical protein
MSENPVSPAPCDPHKYLQYMYCEDAEVTICWMPRDLRFLTEFWSRRHSN